MDAKLHIYGSVPAPQVLWLPDILGPVALTLGVELPRRDWGVIG